MSTQTVKERMAKKLGQDDATSGVEILRFGLAMVVLTLHTWLSAIRIFAERAVRRTGSVLLAIAFFAISVVVYRALLAGYSRAVSLLISRVVDRATDHDSISDRTGAIIGALVGLAVAYAMMRVAKWAVRPYVETMQRYQEAFSPDEFDFDLTTDDDDDDDDNNAGQTQIGVQ